MSDQVTDGGLSNYGVLCRMAENTLAPEYLLQSIARMLDKRDARIAELEAKLAAAEAASAAPEEWSVTEIENDYGYVIRGPGISYCAWRDKDPWLYLFCEALSRAAQQQGGE